MSGPREPRPLVDAAGRRGEEPPAPVPELELLRAAQDRDLTVEGVPMVLVLVDATGALPPPAHREPGVGTAPPDGGGRTDGEALAAGLERAKAALAPTRRDGDLEVVATLVTAVAHADAERRR